MFQNVVIDVAIGLVLMYLMLSLLCTVINEFIASNLFKLRAKNLAQGIQELLDDPAVHNAFYANGLIDGTKKAVSVGPPSFSHLVKNLVSGSADHHPSYLSANTVAMALIGSLQPGQIPAFASVEQAIKNINPQYNIRDALLTHVATAENDINKLRDNIANWFDDSMDRLSGAYKRKLKLISILVGLVVALAFNADSFKVATGLWTDPNLRSQVVEAAAKAVKDETPVATNQTDKKPTPSDVNKAALNAAETLRPLPIGWTCPAEGSVLTCIVTGVWHSSPSQVLGWLLTTAALSLGAPFWFDLLSKFVNIRGAGAKPKREDQKS